MNATATDTPRARLKTRYEDEIRPTLMSRFGYSSVMQAPRLEKITLNMGVGMAKQDSKVLKAAQEQLATIAGQQPSVRRARKSIAAFKLRAGMPVGVSVTLRGERSFEFLDRLVSIAIPRIRDFRGLNPRSFDGRGNYSMGVREQIIFPEIDYDAIDQVRGLDITITTNASSDVEAYALLSALGLPFAAQGRPRGFDPDDDASRAQDEGGQRPGAANPTGEASAAEAASGASEEPATVSAEEPQATAAELAGDTITAPETELADPGGAPDAEASAEPGRDGSGATSAEQGPDDSDATSAEETTDTSAEETTDTSAEETTD